MCEAWGGACDGVGKDVRCQLELDTPERAVSRAHSFAVLEHLLPQHPSLLLESLHLRGEFSVERLLCSLARARASPCMGAAVFDYCA